MNTSQLEYIFKNDTVCDDVFEGVFPSDKIVNIRARKPIACIVNTDPSSMPGSHWIAMYIDRHGYGQFFDSYGNQPSYYGRVFVNFLNRRCKSWTFNAVGLQGPFSATCGQFCTFYLWHKCRDVPLSEIIRSFTTDKELNDVMVNEFVRKKFPLETKVYDMDIVGKQIAVALSE